MIEKNGEVPVAQKSKRDYALVRILASPAKAWNIVDEVRTAGKSLATSLLASLILLWRRSGHLFVFGNSH